MSQENNDISLLDKRLAEIDLEKKSIIENFNKEKKEILHAKYVLSKYCSHNAKDSNYQNEVSDYMGSSVNRCLKRLQVIIKIILSERVSNLSSIQERLNHYGDPIGYNSLQVNISRSSELSLDGRGNVLIVE